MGNSELQLMLLLDEFKKVLLEAGYKPSVDELSYRNHALEHMVERDLECEWCLGKKLPNEV